VAAAQADGGARIATRLDHTSRVKDPRQFYCGHQIRFFLLIEAPARAPLGRARRFHAPSPFNGAQSHHPRRSWL
jgi:hypothetical protein